jgi:predicted ATPase
MSVVTASPTTDRFVIVTGGPGAGKTTLIDALEEAGYARTIEAGRAIIQDQREKGGHALPWDDSGAFAEEMLAWDIGSYRAAETVESFVFFDRGIPDIVGYLRLTGAPVPPRIEQAAATYRYHSRVFVTPPWRDIYQLDNERTQDFDEAVRTYDSLVATYNAYGYTLIELPFAPIAERVRFVLEMLGVSRP